MDFGFEHSLNTSVLTAIPFMFLCLRPRQYVWWSAILKDERLDNLRVWFVGGAMATFIAWVEYRVIFARYPHIMAIPAPYNYIVVTLASYAIVAIVILVMREQLG